MVRDRIRENLYERRPISISVSVSVQTTFSRRIHMTKVVQARCSARSIAWALTSRSWPGHQIRET
jgi:preprotein translocase subunit SecF